MADSFSTEYLHFAVQIQDKVAIVHIRDSKLYEPLVMAEVHDELSALVETRKPRRLLVNFAAVSHCSSEMISILLDVRRQIDEYGGSLCLCGLRDALREAYLILNLEGRIFDIRDSVSVALAEEKPHHPAAIPFEELPIDQVT